jgi:2-iminobutanoate/2-iminopropanoate deaminase
LKKIISTDKAPGAIGPYSQAVAIDCSKLLYCSGQIPLDPASGELVGATAAEQCEQVMKNCEGLLAAGGATFEDVIKTTIFLTTMDDFAAVNEVYGKRFASEPPARATVAVAGLPLGVKVEIEMIAAL